eukprot:3641548-Lingulodinium_polyedra.AAC.1
MAWQAIKEAGAYFSYDWTIKADAETVRFVDDLIPRITLMPVPPRGVFLQDCPEVDYGSFGSLEVVSKTAFSIWLANIETCKKMTVSDWKVRDQKGKYGPI